VTRSPLPACVTLVLALVGCTASLEQVIESGDLEQVRSSLATGEDPNKPNRDGRTPLALAIGRVRPDLVGALLEAGAEPNLPSEYVGPWGEEWTMPPLNIALATLADETLEPPLDLDELARLDVIIEALLRAGADPNLTESQPSSNNGGVFNGRNALMIALSCYASERLDPRAPSSAELTGLCSKLIDRMLEHGAEPGDTLGLMFAFPDGNGPRVRDAMLRLLAAGAEYPYERVSPPSKNPPPDTSPNYEQRLLQLHTPINASVVLVIHNALWQAIHDNDEDAIIRLIHDVELLLELGEDPVYIARRLAPAIFDHVFWLGPNWSALPTAQALLAVSLPDDCTLPGIETPLTARERADGVEITLAEAIARAETELRNRGVLRPKQAAARIIDAGTRGAFVRTATGIRAR
jgi:hypothetical protein